MRTKNGKNCSQPNIWSKYVHIQTVSQCYLSPTTSMNFSHDLSNQLIILIMSNTPNCFTSKVFLYYELPFVLWSLFEQGYPTNPFLNEVTIHNVERSPESMTTCIWE
ncbi:hypothetical protein MS3_00001998 [Schistosoma haematobium]|uniref:Uncharacterized protein n=1 Tax=Schistosoma haematobium TaxID=6185 RepID=A0A922S727_SCHHA|nr:hypothetical protein MS3_00001998 [Schistosoma haematobium]KAH9596267.1 hypothetical protein MS3_00001998 [Schistosoma haematobium]